MGHTRKALGMVLFRRFFCLGLFCCQKKFWKIYRPYRNYRPKYPFTAGGLKQLEGIEFFGTEVLKRFNRSGRILVEFENYG